LPPAGTSLSEGSTSSGVGTGSKPVAVFLCEAVYEAWHPTLSSPEELMTVGLGSKLNILRESPLDRHPDPRPVPPQGAAPPSNRWVASRYNIQTPTEDGRLIVWNTLRGAISAFPADQRDSVKSMLTRRGCEGDLQGMVKYLHDRGFLVAEGTDEYRLFQHQFGNVHYRQDALELILLSSEDCNFRCAYCYEDFVRGTMKPLVRESVKKLVRKKLPTLRYLSVSWFGGEPLYGWQAIEDLAPFFRDIATENEICFRSNMTTNGYLLTPDVAEKLISWGVLRFQITIDGTPEDHNRNRPGRNGEPTFEVIFQNLLALKQRPETFRLDIRINFDQQNRPGLNDFVDLLGREFGGDPRFRLLFRSVGRWGGDNDENLDVCGKEDAQEVNHQLTERAQQRGLGSCDDVRDKRVFGSDVCYAARPYNFIIGADGLVMKCTIDLDKKDRNILGHIDEDGTLQIDKNKLTLWTDPAYASDPACQKCVVLPVCQGMSCPQIRMDENRSPCIPLRATAKKGLLLADQFKASGTRLQAVKTGTV
jgi:uncharacterized protein